MFGVTYGAELGIAIAVYPGHNCNYAVPHSFEEISYFLKTVQSFHYLVVAYKESYLCIDTSQCTVCESNIRCYY